MKFTVSTDYLEPFNTEYDVGEQLPVFPVSIKTGSLHSGLGKRTESGDSGISVNFNTVNEEVHISTKSRLVLDFD